MGLIYVGGHGATVRGSMRFIGVSDAVPSSDLDLEWHSSALSWILSEMALYRRSGARPEAPIVLVADMDTSDLFGKDGSPLSAERMREQIQRELGTLVLLPNVFGKPSHETEDMKNGVFTKNLASALLQEGLSLSQIANRAMVMSHRESKQSLSPQIIRSSLNTDEIVFRPVALRDDPKALGRSARGG